MCQIIGSLIHMKSRAWHASYLPPAGLFNSAEWHPQCFITNTRTHNTLNRHSSHILPTTLCPSGANSNSSLLHRHVPKHFFLFVALYPYYYKKRKKKHLFDLLSFFLSPSVPFSSSFTPLLPHSSSILSFYSCLQFAPPPFSPPSPFPPGSFPLSLPLSKLQHSPLSLCLWEFNQTIKPRISTLIHKSWLVSDASFFARVRALFTVAIVFTYLFYRWLIDCYLHTSVVISVLL